MKPFVYVAGPLSNHPMHNTHEALTICSVLIESGVVIPFSPHVTVLWDMIVPMHYERWMEYDLDVLSHMNAILRWGGESPGADREIEHSKTLGIPQFYEVEPLLAWALEFARR